MFTRCRFTGRKLLKSGLKLIGGKTKTRDILYRLFPAHYLVYLEPFLGSGNVLTGIELPGYPRTEIVGDVNGSVINFFACMQHNHANHLWKVIQRYNANVMAHGGTGWKMLRDMEPEEMGIEHAAWFYIVTKYAMNGIYRRNKEGRCNSSWCGTVQGRGIYTKDWFDAVVDRVKDVYFHHKPYNHLLAEHANNSAAFAFLDPPYRNCQTTYNGISFSDKDHIRLKGFLDDCKFKWMLTINDDPFIRGLYYGYNLIAHEIAYSCSQTPAGRGKRPELIITNYEVPNHGLREEDRQGLSSAQEAEPVLTKEAG